MFSTIIRSYGIIFIGLVQRMPTSDPFVWRPPSRKPKQHGRIESGNARGVQLPSVQSTTAELARTADTFSTQVILPLATAGGGTI